MQENKFDKQNDNFNLPIKYFNKNIVLTNHRTLFREHRAEAT